MSNLTDVPGRRISDSVENVRFITSRGKGESALLVILAGSAASLSAPLVVRKLPDSIVVDRQYITANKGSAFVTILNSYPADIVSGMENFSGIYYPPELFDPAWRPKLLVIDRSYIAYNPATDVTGKAFRRVPFFAEIEPYTIGIQRAKLLTTNLIATPIPASDNTFRARMSGIIYDLPYTSDPWKASWFVPLMPGLDITRPPVVPFAGAGPTQGYFTGYTTIGYFN